MKYILNKSVVINAALQPSEWEIYTDMPGSLAIAGVLNAKLNALVNAGYTKDEVRKLMHRTMDVESAFGCMDTEPRAVLEELLIEIYGD